MTIYAAVSEISPTRLWGVNCTRRLQRQLTEVNQLSRQGCGNIVWLDNLCDAPENNQILLINGSFLFETRTLMGILDHPESVLVHGQQNVAAAFVETTNLSAVLASMMAEKEPIPPGLQIVRTIDMTAFDENLRRSASPLLEPVSEQRKAELENKLYGNAYRGITDLVTKFIWPRPAKSIVHLCANAGISPNMVTGFGLFLVIAACYLFLKGYYGWGLLAGWLMTFLDTVDGKLARVTIQSSKFGHLFDHGIDLFHPPFWYIFWGMSLADFQPLMGVALQQMYWLIIISYVAGRLVEGIFPLLGSCSIFTWRPFDAWFRLVTARRNPNLILLSLSVVIARPELGFIAVVFWSVFTTALLVLRLIYAIMIRFNRGPLTSWLSEADVANGPNAHAYSIFGATRVARAKEK